MTSSKMKRYICNDVWWNILPLLDHFNLGLKLALVSFRFDWLVDKYFDGGKSELTIWRPIIIRKENQTKEAKLSVLTENVGIVDFPLPIGPLPIKIRFKRLQIWCIDHSLITFLHTNKQIFTKGTNLQLTITTQSPEFWEVFVREIWPVFAGNIRRFHLHNDDVNNLRRLISPTVLSDLPLLNSIDSGGLLPDAIAADGPNATAGQALSKWLHTPTTDGQPKRLVCEAEEWSNNFKGAFLRATSSACYIIQIKVVGVLEPFELENERTKEKLSLAEAEGFAHSWWLKRFPIGCTIQWKKENLDHLDNVRLGFSAGDSIGPLSLNEKSSDQCPGPSGQRMK